MKKIITILVLSLIIFAYSQVALAGQVDNCKECCDGVTDGNRGSCVNACGSTTGVTAMQNCQTSCTTKITANPADQSLCQSCCAFLGYNYGSPITSYAQVSNLVISITRWFAAIVFAIAVIMIIYGAVLYITSGGSEDKAKTAKKLLIYACIGIAVAILAFGAQFLVQSFLESGTPGTPGTK